MAHIIWTVITTSFFVICLNVTRVKAFNIYEGNVDIFRGGTGSLFGYSVLQHENTQGKWILVGAPKSSSVQQPSLKSPGALFKCQVNDDGSTTFNQRCEQVSLDTRGNEEGVVDGVNVRELKDDQWLGVSLDSYQESLGSGKVTVCAHRWVNNYDGFYSNYFEYPHGLCYSIDSELRTTTVEKMRPCLTGTRISTQGIKWHGWCQAGSSAHYTGDGTLLLGAPGAIDGRGTVISMTQPNPTIAGWSVWFPTGKGEDSYSYVGYSITSGSFTSPTAKEGVTGAPRTYEVGKVFIFDIETYEVKNQLYGEPVNTYFGSSLAAVDLNNDGLSDLLVGAPLYTDEMDEGRVYVYINQGQGKLQLLDDKLKGNNAIGGRFGTAIGVVGDLNQDGYKDVAIGAPIEDDGSGAVYIYHGSVLGMKTQYVQRLSGKSVNIGLKSFGSSLDGGIDMDGNGYPDIVIGAHQNATIVTYRSQSVLTVKQVLRLSPEVLGSNTTICRLGGSPVTCVRIETCFHYTGYRTPSTRVLTYTLSVDTLRTRQGLQSRFFFLSGDQTYGSAASQIQKDVYLVKEQTTCTENVVYQKTDVRDFLNSIPIQSTYSLQPDSRLDPSSNLPIVLNQEYPHTAIKEAAFLRNCGSNAVCETDIQVSSQVETISESEVLYLGAESEINVDIQVINNGEEAHQAHLSVVYLPDVVYIGFEPILGGVLQCDPQDNDDGLLCRLGNPMQANSKIQFKLRFDVSYLLTSRDRLNFTVVGYTSSAETNDTQSDNVGEPFIPVLVLADVTIRGTAVPEQIIYTTGESERDSLDHYLDEVHQVIGELEQKTVIGNEKDQNEVLTRNNSGLDEGAKMDVDETVIGPGVVFTYEIRNLGPGYVPFSSVVNITLPWRMENGDWLIYLKGIKSMKGIETCNIGQVLSEQSQSLKKQYQWEIPFSEKLPREAEEVEAFDYTFGLAKLDCRSVSCVTITCHIQPLQVTDSVVIEVNALLWKHTFLKHDISVSEMVSEVSIEVDNSSQRFTQPEENKPDTVQVITSIAADNFKLRAKPIPPWIIIAATAAAVVTLIVLILIMTKLGFFHRSTKEEMEKLMAENQEDNIDVAKVDEQ